MKKAMIDYIKKEKNDELYTPEYAIKPLIKYLPKNIKIWECTDFGDSNITKVLKENGYEVITTHKKDFDFLNNKPVALLLPLTSLEGINRGKMYRENGIELLVFDRRCNFIYDNSKKSNWFNTSWFCWNILPKQLIFEELNK